MQPPQWILAGLGVALVVAAVVEMLGDGLVWIYLVHLVAGVVALAVAPRRSWVKPAALLLGGVFLILYVVEAASPDLVGDAPDPSGNASLILTGFVLLAVMVAFMWPWRTPTGAGRR
jgi:hypothetical protein